MVRAHQICELVVTERTIAVIHLREHRVLEQRVLGVEQRCVAAQHVVGTVGSRALFELARQGLDLGEVPAEFGRPLSAPGLDALDPRRDGRDVLR